VSIFEIPLTTIDGEQTSLAPHEGSTILVVNVASRCGLTPQYEALEALQVKYGDRGFTVLGFPSNQFNGQEPGSAEEIKEFCSTSYGVTFPLYEKADVNGETRQPLYQVLTEVPDADGVAGDVQWNFEKFLIAPDGSITRFRPQTVPDSPEIVSAIEASLPS
jgi:glutathione peroxidase